MPNGLQSLCNSKPLIFPARRCGRNEPRIWRVLVAEMDSRATLIREASGDRIRTSLEQSCHVPYALGSTFQRSPPIQEMAGFELRRIFPVELIDSIFCCMAALLGWLGLLEIIVLASVPSSHLSLCWFSFVRAVGDTLLPNDAEKGLASDDRR